MDSVENNKQTKKPEKHRNAKFYDSIQSKLKDKSFDYIDEIDELCDDTIAVCHTLIDDIEKYKAKRMESPLRRARRGTKIIRDLGKVFRRVTVDISK